MMRLIFTLVLLPLSCHASLRTTPIVQTEKTAKHHLHLTVAQQRRLQWNHDVLLLKKVGKYEDHENDEKQAQKEGAKKGATFLQVARNIDDDKAEASEMARLQAQSDKDMGEEDNETPVSDGSTDNADESFVQARRNIDNDNAQAAEMARLEAQSDKNIGGDDDATSESEDQSLVQFRRTIDDDNAEAAEMARLEAQSDKDMGEDDDETPESDDASVNDEESFVRVRRTIDNDNAEAAEMARLKAQSDKNMGHDDEETSKSDDNNDGEEESFVQAKRNIDHDKVANARPNSSYSRHSCHGTTCGFQNICYDLVSDTRRLLYFTQNPDERDTDDMSTLDLRPLSQGANPAVHLDIHKVRGPIPAEAAIYPHAVTVLFQPFGAENFGHELGDDMYAAFAMQQLFRIADPYNSQVMTLDNCDRPEVDGANRSACIGMMAKLYPALSRHPVLQMRALDLMATDGVRAASRQKAKLMCFPLLLAGSGTFSFRSPIVSGRSYFAYRSFLLGNLCPKGACDGAAPERDTILIAKKTAFSETGTGAGIANTRELQDYLSRSFPTYDVQLRDLAQISFKDQAALLARTSVMFSHCGGGSFSALFLPRGATLVVQTARIHYPVSYWVAKEINFWESLDWLNFYNVKVDLTPVRAKRIVLRALAKPQEHKPQAQSDEDMGADEDELSTMLKQLNTVRLEARSGKHMGKDEDDDPEEESFEEESFAQVKRSNDDDNAEAAGMARLEAQSDDSIDNNAE